MSQRYDWRYCESCLTQDEPERAARFQRSMSLKSCESACWALIVSMEAGEKLSLEQIRAVVAAMEETARSGNATSRPPGNRAQTYNDDGGRAMLAVHNVRRHSKAQGDRRPRWRTSDYCVLSKRPQLYPSPAA